MRRDDSVYLFLFIIAEFDEFVINDIVTNVFIPAFNKAKDAASKPKSNGIINLSILALYTSTDTLRGYPPERTHARISSLA
jgi:hypothetical protein